MAGVSGCYNDHVLHLRSGRPDPPQHDRVYSSTGEDTHALPGAAHATRYTGISAGSPCTCARAHAHAIARIRTRIGRRRASTLLLGGALVEVERVAPGVVAERRELLLLPPPPPRAAAAALGHESMISCATAFHRSLARADRASCAARLSSPCSGCCCCSALYSSRLDDDARDSERPKQLKPCGTSSSSHAAIALAGMDAWCTRLAMGGRQQERAGGREGDS